MAFLPERLGTCSLSLLLAVNDSPPSSVISLSQQRYQLLFATRDTTAPVSTRHTREREDLETRPFTGNVGPGLSRVTHLGHRVTASFPAGCIPVESWPGGSCPRVRGRVSSVGAVWGHLWFSPPRCSRRGVGGAGGAARCPPESALPRGRGERRWSDAGFLAPQCARAVPLTCAGSRPPQKPFTEEDTQDHSLALESWGARGLLPFSCTLLPQ